MKIEIDHIFVFTKADPLEAKTLVDAGFKEGVRRIHPGQGTSNVCFFFQNAYLELIWVHNEAETITADESLLKRSNWQQTGFCPFGIGLRSSPDNSPLPDIIKTYDYTPEYLPKGSPIRNVDNGEYFSKEPDLFFLPFARRIDDDCRKHKNGANSIIDIKIVTPYADKLSTALEYLKGLGLFKYQKGERYLMEISIEGGPKRQTVDLSPQLPLRINF